MVTFPFLKKLLVDLGILYIPFVAVVVVGSSNAVNLTDGLDGLAIGAVGIAAGTYAILAYVTGNAVPARYLQIPYIPQSRRARRLLRRPSSAPRWASSGSTAIPRTSSWATSARCPSAPRSRRWPS